MKVYIELAARFSGNNADGTSTSISRTLLEVDAKELELLQRLERQIRDENRHPTQPYMNLIKMDR